MNKITIPLLFCLFCITTNAQISSIIPSSNAVANASVADSKQYSAFANPASLAYISAKQIGFQYENRFLLSELSTKSLHFALASSYVNTAFSASYFGYSLYNEILLGLAFSRNFNNRFSLGLQFNYLSAYFVGNNKYKAALFPQIGLNVALTDDFHLGFSSFNPFQSNIKTNYNNKKLPSIFSLGLEYQFSTNLVFKSQLDKELSSYYRLAMGFEYKMLDMLNLRLGAYDMGYLVPCLGVSYDIASINLGLNTELHPILGLNSIASVKYSFNK